MANIRAILIPGNGGGGPTDNWFPYVKSQLEERGVEVIAREFPDNQLARQSIWIPFLVDEIGVDENTILIGHSSGAIAAMKVAEEHRILGSVLVGTYYTDLGMDTERAAGYFDQPWNFDAIKRNQEWSLIFASEDDPWIPIGEPRFIAEQIGSELHEYKDQGHFGGDYLKLEFPELVEAVTQKIS